MLKCRKYQQIYHHLKAWYLYRYPENSLPQGFDGL